LTGEAFSYSLSFTLAAHWSTSVTQVEDWVNASPHIRV
jgi:hypothetical protein